MSLKRTLQVLLLLLVLTGIVCFLVSMLYVERTTLTIREIERNTNNNDMLQQFSQRAHSSMEAFTSSALFRQHGQELQVLNSPTQCRNGNVLLVALIRSSPADFDTRMAIRKTWANVSRANALGVQTVFVVGLPTPYETEDIDDIHNLVFHEKRRYNDILQGNFIDTFRNGTLKYLMSLKWVINRCSGAKFVFWGDDDLFANYTRIVKQLKGFKVGYDTNLLLGKVVTMSRVVRDKTSKYYVSSEQLQNDVYPPFCTGEAGFVLSMSAIINLYTASWNRLLIPLPDVYTGVIAKQYNWTISHDEAFTYNIDNDCTLRNVITSRVFSNCIDPDLDLVPANKSVPNKYLDTTLRLLHDHPGTCYNALGHPENVFLIVLISSLPGHFEIRDAVRETWGKQREEAGEKLKLLFVMGLTQKDANKMQEKIIQEDRLHGDIIQANFTESFRNLTLKVITGLKWVTEHCSHAQYVYKGDDDMFINVHNIIRHIKDLKAQGQMSRSMLGYVMRGSARINDKRSKYYVSKEDFSGRYYPPYCSGGGYIISTDIIPAMYEHSFTTHLIPIDDAYQGILAGKVGAKFVHHNGFKNWGAKSDKCSLHKTDLMTIHGFKTPDLLFRVWRNYTDETVVCSQNQQHDQNSKHFTKLISNLLNTLGLGE